MTHHAPSIRKRMLLIVGVGVLIATGAQAVVAYRVALAEVAIVSDFHMLEMARAVMRTHPQAMTQVISMPEMGKLPSNQDNVFTLSVERYETPAVSAPSPAKAGHEDLKRAFYNRINDAGALRVLEISTADTRIVVSHDLSIRARTAGRLAMNTILPILATAPLLLLCVGWGVGHALRPMRRIRREIGQRAASDLQPLDIKGVPGEALPLVQEINFLFSRVGEEFEARKDFVADVAHELRSPLAALKLQAECLRRANSEEARAQGHERVMAGINRATRLVEQLLTLAREDTSQLPSEVVALPQVARLALSDTFPLAQARSIDIGADLADHLPEHELSVIGNAEALRVMLRNLLDNAVKYTPAGGSVNLQFKREGSVLFVDVEDSGPGIAPDRREALFARFQRGPQAGDSCGSGLGLAIVRSIARRHGISVSLDQSVSLGGLAVNLRFPVSQAARSA